MNKQDEFVHTNHVTMNTPRTDSEINRTCTASDFSQIRALRELSRILEEELAQANARIAEMEVQLAEARKDSERWLAWSGGRFPDDTIGDVIAAWKDGTVMLDDAIDVWNPLRALEFVANGGALQDAARKEVGPIR